MLALEALQVGVRATKDSATTSGVLPVKPPVVLSQANNYPHVCAVVERRGHREAAIQRDRMERGVLVRRPMFGSGRGQPGGDRGRGAGESREALELHFEEPRATIAPKLRQIEVEIGAA